MKLSALPRKKYLQKTFSLLTFILLFQTYGWGQTTLPVTRTSWASTPTGWTDAPLASYLTTFACSGSDGGKFSVTGDNSQVFFNSAPNQLSFVVKSNAAASTSVLLVEESSNGTVWTTVVSLTGTAGLPAACTTSGPYALLSTSRYVKWSFTKGSSNMTWDDVSITAAASSTTISTSAITGSPFCANTSASVPYTITGTFTAGNVFTAQLSNSAGSFASPVSIGTLASTAAGTITATIPSGTATGSGYRIRVIANTPSTTGADNGTNLTINNDVAASVSIAASPSNSICNGTSVTFTATPTNGGTPSYQWKLNGANVGANATTYINAALVNNDVITCVMTSTTTCVTGSPATSNSITMTVSAPLTPSVSIAASANPACSGTSVTFTATPVNGGTPAYQWKLNAVNVGANSSTYSNSTLVNNDVVTCVMTPTGCVSPATATSNAVTMTINAVPATPTAGSNTPLCATGTLNLTSDAVGTIAWTGPNSFTASTQNPSLAGVTTAAAGTYSVTSTSAGCTSVAGTTVVVVNSAAAITGQPSSTSVTTGATATFTVTATGAGLSYQWEESINGGSSFSPLTNGGVYGGTTLATLTLTGVTVGMDTYKYRCVVSGTCGNATTNGVATLTVTVPTTPTITTSYTTFPGGGFGSRCIGTASSSQNYTVSGINLTTDIIIDGGNAGTIANFQISIDGGANYSYPPVTLTQVGGIVNTTTVHIRNLPVNTTNSFPQIKHTSTGATNVIVSSGSGSQGIAAAAITTHPVNSSVLAISPATFTVTATGGTLTYQWEESINSGGSWHTINDYVSVFTGTLTNTLTINSTATGMSGYQYRCVVTGICGSPVTTNIATLTVNTPTTNACGTQAFSSGTAPTEWTFTPTTLSTYTTAGNFGAASPSIKMGATGVTTTIIETATVTNATQLAFWLKGQTAAAGDNLLIEGFDGTWNTIDNITTTSAPFSFNNASGITATYNSASTPALAAGFSRFKFTFTKASGACSIDDIAITCGAVTATPTVQTSTLDTIITGVYGFRFDWTNGNGIKRLIRINTINSFTDPIDGLYYPADPHYNCTTEQTIYNSSSNKSVIMGLSPNTTYYLKVWEYNGSGPGAKYMTPGTAAFSFTTHTVSSFDKAFNDFDNTIKWFFYYTATGGVNGYPINSFINNAFGEGGTVGFDKSSTVNQNGTTGLSKTTIFMDPIDAKNLAGITLQYKLSSSQDPGTIGEGIDVDDYLECYLLIDGVRAPTTFAITTYGTGNEVFPYNAAKTFSAAYNANATATNTGAANASSYYTVTIPDAPSVTTPYIIEVAFKIANNRINEHWSLDDVQLNFTHVLPIELLSFTANYNGKTVDLKWATASELNNDYFTIERSSDAINFSEIKIIDGAGNSTQTLNYSTVDDAPLSGTSYYRLKQTDFDGKFVYSSIVSVTIENNDGFQIVNTFNSIENSSLNVTVNCGTNNCLVNFELYDMTGKKVFSNTENISGNNKNISISTNTLSSGIYLLKVYNGEKLIAKKLKL